MYVMERVECTRSLLCGHQGIRNALKTTFEQILRTVEALCHLAKVPELKRSVGNNLEGSGILTHTLRKILLRVQRYIFRRFGNSCSPGHKILYNYGDISQSSGTPQ
jgi:hypothetical protein